MVSKTITLKQNNETDFVRFLCQLVNLAGGYQCDCSIQSEDGSLVDLKSILGLMSLCLSYGKTVQLYFNGEDEVQAGLVVTNFLTNN